MGGDSTAFQPTHQHAAQRVAQGRGLATLEGADQENAGLGSILGYLMLNAINLVLQHDLNRGKWRNRWKSARFRRGGAWAGGNRYGAGG